MHFTGSRVKIISTFARALRRFDGDYPIGTHNGGKVPLKDAITLIIKPRGKGNIVKDNTGDLLDTLRWRED